jgi:chemotaxis protein CheZ
MNGPLSQQPLQTKRMARQRAVYRIEEFSSRYPSRAPASLAAEVTPSPAEIMAELRALREAVSAGVVSSATSASPREAEAVKNERAMHDAIRHTKHEIATLVLTSLTNPEMGRMSQELGAVVGGTESATHRILQASEEIEEAAKTLAAALKSPQNRDLARDILDQVTRIFEACNFQDLVGQRVANVSAALKVIEEHIVKLMQIWGGMEKLRAAPAGGRAGEKPSGLLNGPKREDDLSALTQKEVDTIFAARAGDTSP